MQTTVTLKTIDRPAVQAKLGRKPFHLWNVQTAEHYRTEANIPGSRWFPLDEITEAEALKRAAKEDDIVVYCGGTGCSASRQAAAKLSTLGFRNVTTVAGTALVRPQARLSITSSMIPYCLACRAAMM